MGASSAGLRRSPWLVSLLAASLACTAARSGNGGDPIDASVDSETPADRAATPDVPATPDVTATPDVPATPDVTVTPDVPVTPDVTVTPDVPGVPCPSSIAGNGQPCSLVGDGCGGGAGPCGAAYACSCNSAQRWQCTSTPGLCDSGAPDAPVTPDASVTCSILGTYSVNLAALGMLFLSLRSDGQWRFAPTAEALGASTSGGTYTVEGARVTMRETTTSLTGCTPTQYGTYGFTFGAGCATLVLTVVTDPCSLRATVLSGQTLTRL